MAPLKTIGVRFTFMLGHTTGHGPGGRAATHARLHRRHEPRASLVGEACRPIFKTLTKIGIRVNYHSPSAPSQRGKGEPCRRLKYKFAAHGTHLRPHSRIDSEKSLVFDLVLKCHVNCGIVENPLLNVDRIEPHIVCSNKRGCASDYRSRE